jgi:hypothetical protein
LGNISPQDAARRKAEAEAEVEMRRSTLRKTAGCVNYLYRRGVPVETIRFRRYQSGSVLAGRGFMAALCPEQSGESIQRCVGMITLLRHKHEDPAEAGRMVILIPEGEEDGGEKELKELAVKAGFEFMTPDELVAEFGPKASN